PWTNVAAEIDDLADELGLAVDDVALVSGARLWSLVCGNPACCPPEGRSISGTSAAVAAATYAGLVALPDRASVAALLDPAPDDDRQCLGQALYEAESDAVAAVLRGDEARRHRSTVRALFATARALDEAGADGVLDDATLVRFGAALQSIPLRDSAWIAVDCERVDGRALWRRLGTLLPPPYDAPPLFLFGWASYRRGDGALAGIAAERALQSDPDYSAADLLLSALTQAIDPRRLPRLRGSSSARAGGRPTLAGPAARGGRRGGQPGAGGPKRR
ncbi:MAG: DUF4192 domain-containing protein, partial [Jatrophihabitantaceae bacterium]